ncbi:MAG: PIN domain-containing protein [Anaerolineae bacterium]|nr:PIN domain-containing protein [Anaerolineae bacterium]
MAAKPRVLIDVNVILDVLQKREPHYAASAGVLASIEARRVEGAMAAHSVTTLFYLIARGQSPAQARATLTDLGQFLAIAPVDQAVIEQALNLPCPDFEGAVQMIAALHYGAQYLITRNVQDYRAGPLPALQPAEFLALLASS